jgi:hypothetical protein
MAVLVQDDVSAEQLRDQKIDRALPEHPYRADLDVNTVGPFSLAINLVQRFPDLTKHAER